MSKPTPPGNMPDEQFGEVLALIHSARQRAVQAVNTQLVELYWQVGAYISPKLEQAEWGDAVVTQLADYLARTQPGLNGFTRRNLFRMRQFYEAYRGDEKVSALLTQLPWTHNVSNPVKVTPVVTQSHSASLVIPAKAGIHSAQQRIAA